MKNRRFGFQTAKSFINVNVSLISRTLHSHKEFLKFSRLGTLRKRPRSSILPCNIYIYENDGNLDGKVEQFRCSQGKKDKGTTRDPGMHRDNKRNRMTHVIRERSRPRHLIPSRGSMTCSQLLPNLSVAMIVNHGNKFPTGCLMWMPMRTNLH